jgi:tRNA-specific 2-thiouridylase
MSRVVVGLSGGVDSSVAALLLLEQGYEVIGMFMKNWHDETVVINNECPWEEDSKDALMVAEKLGIPFQTIDLSKEYKERIVDYMFSEYEAGRTPNPDVLCNREIKFDVFLKAAQKLGADYVATGHYCQKGEVETSDGKSFQLLAGADKNKDQSYFLCQITQEQLSKAMFPIGHLQKPEVRELAAKAGLITAEKRDSQGLCFIGKISLPDFLQQQLKPMQGNILEIPKDFVRPDQLELSAAKQLVYDFIHEENGTISEEIEKALERISEPIHFTSNNGEVVGTHSGAHYFTIGQRKGLQVGGKEEPLFVLETDTKKNLIYTGQGDDHPGLYRNCLKMRTSEINWIEPQKALETNSKRSLVARVRYRQPLQNAVLVNAGEYSYLWFEKEQRGITSGQFAAWYSGEELLGSSVIW